MEVDYDPQEGRWPGWARDVPRWSTGVRAGRLVRAAREYFRGGWRASPTARCASGGASPSGRTRPMGGGRSRGKVRLISVWQTSPLSPLPELEDTGLSEYFSSILVGQVDDSESFLVAFVGAAAELGERSFLAVLEAESFDVARARAGDIEHLFRAEATPSEELFGGPIPLCDCEDCSQQLNEDMTLCTAISFLCVTAAAAAGAACVIGCPPCAPACAVATAAAVAACTLSLASCNRQAVTNFNVCERLCVP